MNEKLKNNVERSLLTINHLLETTIGDLLVGEAIIVDLEHFDENKDELGSLIIEFNLHSKDDSNTDLMQLSETLQKIHRQLDELFVKFNISNFGNICKPNFEARMGFFGIMVMSANFDGNLLFNCTLNALYYHQ